MIQGVGCTVGVGRGLARAVFARVDFGGRTQFAPTGVGNNLCVVPPNLCRHPWMRITIGFVQNPTSLGRAWKPAPTNVYSRWFVQFLRPELSFSTYGNTTEIE